MFALGHFGFSMVGAVFLIGLFVPNAIWGFSAQPAGYDPGLESRALRALERVGQASTTATAVAFADTNLRPWSPWSWWLVAATVLMVVYEAGWIRYFKSGRTTRELYRSFVGVPLPLATLPVAAFFLLGAYGRLLPLIMATVVLGIGHVGIHLQHSRALSDDGPSGERAIQDGGSRAG